MKISGVYVPGSGVRIGINTGGTGNASIVAASVKRQKFSMARGLHHPPSELATLENTLFAFPPISRIVPTTITRITASITAYSAMSWPSSFDHISRKKLVLVMWSSSLIPSPKPHPCVLCPSRSLRVFRESSSQARLPAATSS